MERITLSGYDEEDDLYSGFNEFHPTLNTSNLIQDQVPRETKALQAPIPVSAHKNIYTLSDTKQFVTYH